MSRTMKTEELIRALAFVANPETLIKPDPAVTNLRIRDDSLGGGFRASVAKGLTKMLSAHSLLDLYGIDEDVEDECVDSEPSLKHLEDLNLSTATVTATTTATATAKAREPQARTLQKASSMKLKLGKASSMKFRKHHSDRGLLQGNEESSSSLSSSSQQDHKGVCFGTVEVRKYPITIGTNPSVRGIPTTLEWDYLEDETEMKHINAYERDRPNEERKHGDDLVLDSITRAKRLKKLGYTKPQLMEAMREINECKSRQRKAFEFSR